MEDVMLVLLIVVIVTGAITYAIDQTPIAGPVKLFCRIAFVVPSVALVVQALAYLGIKVL
jgi:hypothetical protein